MYEREVAFHKLINTVTTIKDPMVAEIVAREMYRVVYGLNTDHSWADCLVRPEEADPYYEYLHKFLGIYKNLSLASMGVSFDTFMSYSQEALLTLIEAATPKHKDKNP